MKIKQRFLKFQEFYLGGPFESLYLGKMHFTLYQKIIIVFNALLYIFLKQKRDVRKKRLNRLSIMEISPRKVYPLKPVVTSYIVK